MKTILTLKTSSMFFIGSVNLYKGVPVQVDSDNLSASTIRIVNQAITSGRLDSTEGLLEVPTKEVKAETIAVEVPPVKVEEVVEAPVAVVEDEVKADSEVTEEAPVVEAEVKAPVKKKTAPATKKKAD